MFTKLKTNLALFTCFAFVFGLLFLLSTFNSSQKSGVLGNYFSTIQKGKRLIETSVQSSIMDYMTLDVCEENLDDDDDLMKAHSSVTLSVFYSLLNNMSFIPKVNHLFDLIKCDLYPKKYLTLSILRL
jgi:hypothetical protein